ncbi:hypothetical protein PG1C_12320 [Rugosibacter aromaticivorans]|uniref:Uncharacterized protein n=1 Tax=Rugosibacter aromaticivorans TaxID=1565605 RepID=A0A0C5JNU1_9PROT|nr:hypothetical protein [Rugosibacter aromaticivorans]AJP48996.1 hypothetical protein PG1C_12320 [Rugosibacter aromaticivorans]TBR12932.1 MAG: hypothetical protein EPO43_12340 [Rugosibacter sp.]
MKQAKQKQRQQALHPRHLLATHPLMKKGSAHLRTDKRASRARLKAQQRTQKRREVNESQHSRAYFHPHSLRHRTECFRMAAHDADCTLTPSAVA